MKQYDTELQKWGLFCKKTGTDSFTVDVPRIVQFLTELFLDGASYGTLNSCRSALSLILGEEVGRDPMIKRTLRGARLTRPPRPRYDETWDPGLVLRYLESLPTNKDLANEDLSKKTATLVAIATAHRVQTLALMKLKNITYFEDKIEVKITDPIKTSFFSNSSPVLVLPYFEKRKICPARAIVNYITATKELRANTDNVFISARSPYNAVGAQTIARWIKVVLRESGIDTTIFKGQSTRHAASSKAKRKGVDIESIRKAADWKKEDTFARFYNRPLKKDNKAFANVVLNLSSSEED